jgi:hypothetical protein
VEVSRVGLLVVLSRAAHRAPQGVPWCLVCGVRLLHRPDVRGAGIRDGPASNEPDVVASVWWSAVRTGLGSSPAGQGHRWEADMARMSVSVCG